MGCIFDKYSNYVMEWIGISVGDIAIVKVKNDKNVEYTRFI